MTELGANIKKLGFGLMRLPKIGDDIDIEQTKKMVDLLWMPDLHILIRHGHTQEARMPSARH